MSPLSHKLSYLQFRCSNSFPYHSLKPCTTSGEIRFQILYHSHYLISHLTICTPYLLIPMLLVLLYVVLRFPTKLHVADELGEYQFISTQTSSINLSIKSYTNSASQCRIPVYELKTPQQDSVTHLHFTQRYSLYSLLPQRSVLLTRCYNKYVHGASDDIATNTASGLT